MNLSIIEKDKIYDYLSINKEKFIYKKKEVDSIYTLNILINDFNYDIVKVKTKYGRRWCKLNGYKYILITDKWFIKNYNEDLVREQPDEKKIIKNLRQFKNEDKKYKKNRL